MAQKITRKNIGYANSLSITNLNYNFTGKGQQLIIPRPKIHNNSIKTGTTANVIALDCLQHLHDEFYTAVTWGQGFAIFSLANDGTSTRIYHDNTPFSPDYNYAYYNCLAVSDDKLTFFVSNYVYRRITKYVFQNYDYSDTPTKTVLNPTTHSIPNADFGRAYRNGICLAKDWLYVSVDSSSDGYRDPIRWNYKTQTKQILSFKYGYDNNSNTNRYGRPIYNKDSDTIYVEGWYRNYVVFDAASDDPKAHVLKWTPYFTTSERMHGASFIDSNTIFQPMRGGAVILDISTLRENKEQSGYSNATAETYTKVIRYIGETAGYHNYLGTDTSVWGETRYHYEPEVDKVIKMADRGTFVGFTEHDTTNNIRIDGDLDRVTTRFYLGGYQRSHTRYPMSYGGPAIKVTAPNGTEYWVMSYYSTTHRVFAGDVVKKYWFEREDKASITFYGSALRHSDNSNIDAVTLRGLQKNLRFQPQTGIEVYVSNDNGSTFEKYNYLLGEYVHYFKSTGSYLRVKIDFNGSSPYFAYYAGYSLPYVEMLSNVEETKEALKEKTIRKETKVLRRFKTLRRRIGR